MTALHIVQGDIDNGDKARIEKAAREGLDAPMWTAPKHAIPGGDVVMYVLGYGFFATATIKSEPKPRDDWPNRYGADLTAIELIEPAISLAAIIRHVPSLRWANNPRSITTPDSNVAVQIRKLIQNRRTTQTPDLDEASLLEANSDELRQESVEQLLTIISQKTHPNKDALLAAMTAHGVPPAKFSHARTNGFAPAAAIESDARTGCDRLWRRAVGRLWSRNPGPVWRRPVRLFGGSRG